MDNLDILKDDIVNVWNVEKFKIIREPLIIKEYTKSKFKDFNNCLDMPIKLKNEEKIKLPEEYSKDKFLKELINEALNYEKKINKDWKNYYMYLTLHRSMIQKGKTQRNPGWHIDGMQGIKYPNKLKVCHSYLFSDVLETEFAIQSFDATNLSYKHDNWFKKLGEQVNEENIKKYGKNKLVLMSAYQVHRSQISNQNILKNFIRIEFSLKNFNRIGNTINPLIKTNWKYENREIPKNLL